MPLAGAFQGFFENILPPSYEQKLARERAEEKFDYDLSEERRKAAKAEAAADEALRYQKALDTFSFLEGRYDEREADVNAQNKEIYKMLIDHTERANSNERLREKLNIVADFQNKQIGVAGKYKALFALPKQIMNAFTIPAAIAATGQISAANTLAVAGGNIGQMYAQGVKPMQVNVPTVNYGFTN